MKPLALAAIAALAVMTTSCTLTTAKNPIGTVAQLTQDVDADGNPVGAPHL